MAKRNGKKNKSSENLKSLLLYFLVAAFFILIFYTFAGSGKEETSVPLSEAVKIIKEDRAEKVEVLGSRITIFGKDGKQYVSRKEDNSPFLEVLQNSGVDPTSLSLTIKDSSIAGNVADLAVNVLQIVLLIAFFLIIMRQARGASDSVFSFGKSRARLFNKDNPKVSFSDVAGVDEAKKELSEIVEFLKEPEKFRKLGARTPKGVLLVGPSGVGKTLLARALAGEAAVPFFSMAGSEFMEMLVGVGASRVRDLFDTAKKSAPSIIFIDEVESIGRRRGTGMMGGHDEREQTLNQILVEMDGFEINTSVVVVAASVTGETPVLVRKKGRVKLATIKEIIDPYYLEGEAAVEKASADIEVLGFDHGQTSRNNGRSYFGNSAFKKVRSVFRHHAPEIYEVEYLGGRLRTTGNHSVFVRTRRGVEARAVTQLERGDCLVDIPYVANRANKGRREVRAHRFETEFNLKLPVYAAVFENHQEWNNVYEFVMANQGKISQAVMGAHFGLSQTVISHWQRGENGPRALSREYFNHKLPETVEVTGELLRLLGYYTAEGYARKELDFCFSTKEIEKIAEVKELMLKIFGLTPDRQVKRRSAVNIVYYSKPLAEFFGKYCGRGAHHKHVPEFLFEAPKEYFVEFLRGYSRGDGYRDKSGRLEMTSVSQQLITELNWLSRMHGFKSFVHSFTAKAGRIINDGKPLKAVVAWRLGFGKSQNPLERISGRISIKRPVVRSVRKVDYNGFVYDFCGCENEAFFGGVSPVLLHNTNRPDLLDPALIRPGRFDRQVRLDLPDIEGRKAILKIHMKGKPVAAHVDISRLAKRTVGFSGADIENMLNEAAILAAREGKSEVDGVDFEEAATKVTLGPERRRLQSDEEKKRTAYHEAGHALVSAFQPGMDPVHRISIVSRGLALGFTMIPPVRDRYNETRTRFLEQITTMLGGRAAEELVFNELTAGASNDIENATKVSRAMVTEYGMSDLGPIAYGSLDEGRLLLSPFGESSSYSEEMARRIDLEIKRIIDGCYEKAKGIISQNLPKLDDVVKALLEKETLEGEEFEKIIGKVSNPAATP